MAFLSLSRSGHALMLSLPLIALAVALPMQGAAAVEQTSPSASDNSNPGYHATESIDACMRKWDPGTHMSREAWRDSCNRIKNERERYVKDR